MTATVLHLPGKTISNPTATSSIYEQIHAHNVFFDNIVDMIPANLYVPGNTGDDAWGFSNKYHKGQHKESKEARRARNKAAKAKKFDPNRMETTLQAKKRLAEEAAEHSDDDDDEEENDNEEIPDDHEEEKEDAVVEEVRENVPPGDTEEEIQLSGKSRIEFLRAKLHAKIAEKQRQSNRPLPTKETANENASMSKRAKRREEKRKRIETAKARNNGGKSSVIENHSKSRKVIMTDDAKLAKKRDKTGASPGIKDDLAGIDFGSIAGLTQKKNYVDNKSLANTGGKNKKSLERQLEEAERKKERIASLKAGDAADQEKAKKMEWGDTLKEASGEKLNNNTTIIKKAIKRKIKKKAKSAEAWKSRMQQTEAKMQERQKIRGHNLDKRKLGGASGANLSSKQIKTTPGGDGDTGSSKDGKKRRRAGPHSGKEGAEGGKADAAGGGDKKGKSGGSKPGQ